MTKNVLPLTAVALMTAMAAPASAVTVMNNVSGVYDESGGNASDAPAGAIQLNDFNETASNPTLNIVGDTHIFGFVAHRNVASGPRYTDKWAMDFGTSAYDVVFRWTGLTNAFDGQLVVNGDQNLLGKSGELQLGTYTGFVDFNLDPIFGKLDPTETAKWDLEVSQVPLPAGAVLMLSGLAGFAALRRRKKA